jgi:hypothetical protein
MNIAKCKLKTRRFSGILQFALRNLRFAIVGVEQAGRSGGGSPKPP